MDDLNQTKKDLEDLEKDLSEELQKEDVYINPEVFSDPEIEADKIIEELDEALQKDLDNLEI
jgi:hypothetical protein